MEKPSFSHPKILVTFLLLGLCALGSGCAALAALPISSVVGSPNTSALQIYNTTQVRLEKKDFIVVKINLVGQSKGFSLFGLITIVPPRFTKAMSRLYGYANMQPGKPQTLVDMVMEENSSFYVLFGIPRISIRADVVEFTESTPTTIQPQPPPAEAGSKTPSQ